MNRIWDNIRFNFVNAESAQVFEAKIEWHKNLRFLANLWDTWLDLMYLSGNTTLSDSEIYIPLRQGVVDVTNNRRPMTQQSPCTLNHQLGFDAPNLRQSASILYNAFGERVFFAGIGGQADGCEQPFHSLDLVYSWFPTDNLSFKLRVKNIL